MSLYKILTNLITNFKYIDSLKKKITGYVLIHVRCIFEQLEPELGTRSLSGVLGATSSVIAVWILAAMWSNQKQCGS